MTQHSAASPEEDAKRRAVLLNRQRRCSRLVTGREESLDELPGSRLVSPGQAPQQVLKQDAFSTRERFEVLRHSLCHHLFAAVEQFASLGGEAMPDRASRPLPALDQTAAHQAGNHAAQRLVGLRGLHRKAVRRGVRHGRDSAQNTPLRQIRAQRRQSRVARGGLAQLSTSQ
jgi:hypothetical protein